MGHGGSRVITSDDDGMPFANDFGAVPLNGGRVVRGREFEYRACYERDPIAVSGEATAASCLDRRRLRCPAQRRLAAACRCVDQGSATVRPMKRVNERHPGA